MTVLEWAAVAWRLTAHAVVVATIALVLVGLMVLGTILVTLRTILMILGTVRPMEALILLRTWCGAVIATLVVAALALMVLVVLSTIEHIIGLVTLWSWCSDVVVATIRRSTTEGVVVGPLWWSADHAHTVAATCWWPMG